MDHGISISVKSQSIGINTGGLQSIGVKVSGGSNLPAPVAENDFIVANTGLNWIKKTLGEIRTILGLGSAAYTESTDYADSVHAHDEDYEPANTNIQEHIADNTQAHSDYLLNTGDTATGVYNFDTNTFVIDSINHRVGIGTTEPGGTLEIGSGQLLIPKGLSTAPAIAFSGDKDTGMWASMASRLGFVVDGTQVMTASPTWFQFQVQMQTTPGTAAAPGYSFRNNADTGMLSPGDTHLAFSVGGTEKVRIEEGGNVGIGTATPNANAILDITSITKAFMPPRMTTTQRDNIPSPTEGMVIYNLTTHVLNFHNGTAWDAV